LAQTSLLQIYLIELSNRSSVGKGMTQLLCW